MSGESKELSAPQKRILEFRKSYIEPCARQLCFQLSPSSAVTSAPMVLFLGNHSSGKSTIINHFLGQEVQRTGVAPTDDSFTVLMHGEEESRIDGPALLNRQDLPFSDLEQFGPGLTRHFSAKTVNCPLLEKVHIIDSPGMIDSADQKLQRPYDYVAVVKWLAERCDLVFLLFDPDKPGTTGETLTVLSEALADADNLRIIMNKLDQFHNMRDFARTYGALCWNLSRSLQTKDLPHVYTTVVPSVVEKRDTANFPLHDFEKALEEIRTYVQDLPRYRRDNIISDTLEETKCLLMRGKLMAHMYGAVSGARWRARFFLLVASALLGTVAYFCLSSGLIPAGIICLLLTVTVFGLLFSVPERLAKMAKESAVNDLESFFDHEYRRDLAEREHAEDLTARYERVKPAMLRTFQRLDLGDVTLLGWTQLRRLKSLIETDIPKLRDS